MAASNFFVQSTTINHTGIFSSLPPKERESHTNQRHISFTLTLGAFRGTHIRAYESQSELRTHSSKSNGQIEMKRERDRNSNSNSSEKKWFTSTVNALLPIASLLPFEYFVGFPRGCKAKYPYVFLAAAQTRTHTARRLKSSRVKERARASARVTKLQGKRYKSISLRLFYVPHTRAHSLIRLARMLYFGNDAIRMRYEHNIIDTAPLESNGRAFAATASPERCRSKFHCFRSRCLIYASHNMPCGAAQPTNG